MISLHHDVSERLDDEAIRIRDLEPPTIDARGIPRVAEVLVAVFVLIIAMPLWLVAVAAVRCTSRGPVLHRAARVGRGGQVFILYKLRTMTTIPQLEKRAVASCGNTPLITAYGDPRVTVVGRALRRTKLDELPQLWNVILGDMSLVGPRPEDPAFVEAYTPEQRQLLAVRPGITSPASLSYRHEEAILAGAEDVHQAYVEVVLPAKLEIDLAWLNSRSVWTDCTVVAATVLALFR